MRPSRQTDEQLPDPGHHGAGVVADGVWIDRHVAPAEHVASFRLDDFLNRFLFALPAEYHRNAERRAFLYRILFAAFAPFAAQSLPNFFLEELVRNLEQQSGAVASLGIIAGGAAVQKALEDRHAVHDDLVGGFAGEVATISWEASPERLATMPTPQLSCSNSGL